MFFLAVVYFYIGVMYSCVKGGITPSRYYLLLVRIQYTKIAFRNLAYIKGYGIEVIILPTQHSVRMALLSDFLKGKCFN